MRSHVQFTTSAIGSAITRLPMVRGVPATMGDQLHPDRPAALERCQRWQGRTLSVRGGSVAWHMHGKSWKPTSSWHHTFHNQRASTGASWCGS